MLNLHKSRPFIIFQTTGTVLQYMFADILLEIRHAAKDVPVPGDV
jgi:hypothetical protein